MPRSLRALPLLILFSLCLADFQPAVGGETTSESTESSSESAATQVQYNRDIRPILTDNCFACHGPDSEARQAGLRLDQRDEALAMGVIAPGEPEFSPLIDRISRDEDDELAMPPADGHKRLTEEQKKLLTQWIRQGAEYDSHWSLTPPTQPEAPTVQNEAWVRNPIDAFVLAKLEDAGLSPAPEADRRTLARRLSLDLTGLPPTPEQVDAFVNDSSADYYERYVDQLLDSQAWGEHRGRYWLDYARYADTHGIHFDNYREIWGYRDWVIDAFNRNQPFDQFSIEQLAGDLLPDPTLDQLIATGFNRCNITTNEGGIIDEEYKVLYARDRTETTSAVWLGLTTGCAVCHDHKFDPITSKDFYSLSAFFNNTTQPVRDGNIADTPPVVTVPRDEDRARWQTLPAEIDRASEETAQARDEARKQFETQAATLTARNILERVPSDSLIAHLPLSSGSGPAVTTLIDGHLSQQIAAKDHTWAAGHVAPSALQVSAEATVELPELGDFERDQAYSVAAWVWLPSDRTNGSIVARMEDGPRHRGWDLFLENNRLVAHVIHAWPDNAIKAITDTPLQKETWTHVALTYDGSSEAEGLKFYVNGQQQTQRNVSEKSLTGTTRTQVPFKIGTRTSSARITGTRLNGLRLYSKTLAAAECKILATATRVAYIAARPPDQRDESQREELFTWWAEDNAPEYQQRLAAEQALRAQRDAIKARGTVAHVMNEADGEATAHILVRGEYDQKDELVTADTPDVLPPMDPRLPKNRLGLAKWFFDEDHPLTARVTVNRFWQEVFGTGLVETAGDFGVTGKMPTHPELLDHLAVQFRQSGWDVKELFRSIVTSATYRQAAVTTPEKLAQDSENQLLSRGPRFRMDAEMVRDHALFVSGLLSQKIGGPSVRPYQPPGVWEAVAMPESNTRSYQRDQGEALYRRSMYTFWKRSAPPASMDILNAPSRETCTVQRDRTNTPLQALVTLNGTQFIEAARQLATLVLRHSSEDDVRIETLARRLLARPFTDQETTVVARSLEKLRQAYAADPEDAQTLIGTGASPVPDDLDPVELAAWTMLCNQLMNLDEVLNK